MKVYTNSTMHAQCAASSAFFGPGSKRNVAERVPGTQTSPHAELFAILLALRMTPTHRSLVIHTRSTSAIKVVVYLSPTHKECGWVCANADLLKNINDFLCAHTAPAEFILVQKDDVKTNEHVEIAIGMSIAALRQPANNPEVPILLLIPVDCPADSVPLDIPKVFTNVPNEDPHPDGPLPPCEKPPHAHRGRKRTCLIQEKNKNHLLNARSLQHWWKIVDDLGGRRLNDEGVTADQLYEVFKKWLNPPEELPVDFDKFCLGWDRMSAKDIPQVTTDRTTGRYFSTDVGDDNVVRVKTHTRKTGAESSHGANGVDYDLILEIPNEDLVKLCNECLK